MGAARGHHPAHGDDVRRQRPHPASAPRSRPAHDRAVARRRRQRDRDRHLRAPDRRLASAWVRAICRPARARRGTFVPGGRDPRHARSGSCWPTLVHAAGRAAWCRRSTTESLLVTPCAFAAARCSGASCSSRSVASRCWSARGVIDPSAFGDAWRLWPLLLVGLGLAILLGRGRSGLAVTVILALVLGTAGGAALATGGSWIGAFGSCAGTSTATDHLTDGGALGPNGRVELRLDCGEATVGPVGGVRLVPGRELPREPADRHRDRLEPADRLARPAGRPLPALDHRPADGVDARAGRHRERRRVLDRPGRHDARRHWTPR